MGNPAISANSERADSRRITMTAPAPNKFLQRYFYFGMSLMLAAIVVTGFQRTVDQNLFHPALPRPLILWFHGAAFSAWIVFFIAQSTLVRIRKVSWHRFIGWFGTGLAAAMVLLGFRTAIVMDRFDTVTLHQTGGDAFLSVPFYDMIAFGILIGLLILLGVARDLFVEKRVHKVYVYALPLLIVGQSLSVYMWRHNPARWQGITHAIMG